MAHLDPHERPPDGIRNIYKQYQKMKLGDLELDSSIIDLSSHVPASLHSGVRVVAEWRREDVTAAFRAFSGEEARDLDGAATSLVSVYEHEDMPANSSQRRSTPVLTSVGLHIIPSLLPPSTQSHLLSALLHGALSSPEHLTNIHTHYTLSYPPDASSFFSLSPTTQAPVAHPLDPTVHKPLSVAPLLDKKLRWTTLGGQYDWTNKRYPDTPPPPFPHRVKALLESLFMQTKAEAAIVNMYSPGDTLSVHRDVAENSPTGLVSLSLGCDAVFVIGTVDKVVTLRLRSGSAVYMSGPSRFAWHGVPRIVPDTCPHHLAEWPASAVGEQSNEFEAWRGWMRGKRVNLNVRQMWD